MLEEIRCNLCHSSEYDVLYKGNGLQTRYKKEMYYPTSSNLAFENIVKCRNCGLIYINPQLTPDILEGFYSEGKDKEYIGHISERIQTFHRVMDTVERFIQGGRLLDIGCGAGFLLSAAKERGWDAKGIEPNNWFVDFGRNELGLDIANKSVNEIEFPQNYFDVIMLSDALEHLTNPFQCLAKAYGWLKAGGYIFINTPNIDSIFAKVFKSKWWFIESMHLYYFSPSTLKKYLRKTGFKFIQVRPHYQTLKLVYVVSKLRLYSELISKTLTRLLSNLKLKDLKITYYAGQMIAIAQKDVKKE